MNYSRTRKVKEPQRGTSASAGLDFFVPSDFPRTLIGPNESINIPSGIRMRVPKGFMLCAFNKSGIASKMGLLVGAQVVDEDYTGEIHINVHNVSKIPQTIIPDMKLIQFVLIPVMYGEPTEVEPELLFPDFITERGEGGFGSTGA